MEARWPTIAKAVLATVLVTTVCLLALVAWWLHGHEVSVEPRAAQANALLDAPSTARRAATAIQPYPNASGLIMPVAGVRPEQLIDTYTQARANGRRHDAIDIMAPRGTPVIAAAAGRVEKLFLSKDGGNTVYVRSPDGSRIYYYAHLDSYAPRLSEGAVLRQGEPVGTVGSTGNADAAAPHLHFAIWITSPERKWYAQATAINPYSLLRRR